MGAVLGKLAGQVPKPQDLALIAVLSRNTDTAVPLSYRRASALVHPVASFAEELLRIWKFLLHVCHSQSPVTPGPSSVLRESLCLGVLQGCLPRSGQTFLSIP